MMWEKSRFNFFLIMGMGMNGTKFFISTTFKLLANPISL